MKGRGNRYFGWAPWPGNVSPPTFPPFPMGGYGRGRGFGRGRGPGFSFGFGLGPIWQAVPYVPGMDPQTYYSQLQAELERRLNWHENLLTQYKTQLEALANATDQYSLQQKAWLEQAIAFHEARITQLRAMITGFQQTPTNK